MQFFYNILSNYCRRVPEVSEEHFYEWCRHGDLSNVKYILEKGVLTPNLNIALEITCDNNFKELAEYLILKGASNLDECLKKACQQYKYDIVELLVQRGANVSIGLRYSKSANITRMLYRYEQKSELINN